MNGTSYTFTVTATNAAGASSASSASSAVTPRTTPAAPTSLAATPDDGSASIAFTAGSSNGAAISNYQYSTDDGATWTARSPSSDASPIDITGLTNGTTYPIKLRAINSQGTGAASSAVSVTPAAAPAAPTGLAATPGDGSATIAFTAGSGNGAAISNYQYSTNDGATWTTRSPTSAASPIAITGLTNGTTYQIKLRAVNSQGTSAESSAVSATPAAAPAAQKPTPTPTPTPTPAPTPTPTPTPAKPFVTWASSAKAKSITAGITPVVGVTYTLTATSGQMTKTGSCKTVTIKRGTSLVAGRSCTIKLAKGKWLAAVTPKQGSVSGTVNTKSYTFK